MRVVGGLSVYGRCHKAGGCINSKWTGSRWCNIPSPCTQRLASTACQLRHTSRRRRRRKAQNGRGRRRERRRRSRRGEDCVKSEWSRLYVVLHSFPPCTQNAQADGLPAAAHTRTSRREEDEGKEEKERGKINNNTQ